MNITAGVTICRNSGDEIHIIVRDNRSGISFVNVNTCPRIPLASPTGSRANL